MVRIRKFNSFLDSWKLFVDISVPFAAVSKFSKVLVEWKAQFNFAFCSRLNFEHYFESLERLELMPEIQARGCEWGIAVVSKWLKKCYLVSNQLKNRYLVSRQQKKKTFS